MKNKKIVIFCLILLLSLLIPRITRANYPSIVISEIAAYEASNHEWIEIFNITDNPIDLTGWKFYEDAINHSLSAFSGDLIIEPGEYAIIADVAENFSLDYPEFNGTIIDSSWSSLREDGEEIGLVDNNAEIIENFTYEPAPDTSLQRVDLYVKDYSAINWKVHLENNSAGRENEIPPETCPLLGDINRDGNIDEADFLITKDMLSGLVAYDPCADIDGDGVIGPADYAKMNDAVNNYPGNFAEELLAQQTETPVASFVTETEAVKATATTSSSSSEVKVSYENKIIINEIFPNPKGSDVTGEWIELKNISQNTVDLNGWQIQDESKKTYTISNQDFTNTKVNRNDFFLIQRQVSGLALNNDQETLKLISPDNKLRQTVKYTEEYQLSEDASYALGEKEEWFWTITPTKTQPNKITRLNHSPEIEIYCPSQGVIDEVITCDASDSFDSENDNLNFSWEVEGKVYEGEIMEHEFAEEGTYYLQIMVDDGAKLTTTKHKIKITEEPTDQVKKNLPVTMTQVTP